MAAAYLRMEGGGVLPFPSGSRRPRLRERLENAIERMIAVLDALDGDPDLEDSYDLEAVCEDEGSGDEREDPMPPFTDDQRAWNVEGKGYAYRPNDWR